MVRVFDNSLIQTILSISQSNILTLNYLTIQTNYSNIRLIAEKFSEERPPERERTHQLFVLSLSFLPPPDLHIHLVASVLQLDLQRPPVRLGFGQHLLTGAQRLVRLEPLFTARLKAGRHLDKL